MSERPLEDRREIRLQRNKEVEKHAAEQAAIDECMQLGFERSKLRFATPEAASEAMNSLLEEIGLILEKAGGITNAVATVTGETVHVPNMELKNDGEPGVIAKAVYDEDEQIRTLGPFESETVTGIEPYVFAYSTDDQGRSALGVKLWADNINTHQRTLRDATTGMPICQVSFDTKVIIPCDGNNTMEVVAHSRESEQRQSIDSLQGRVGSGIVRTMRSIDTEAAIRESGEPLPPRTMQQLRLVSRYAVENCQDDDDTSERLLRALRGSLQRGEYLNIGGTHAAELNQVTKEWQPHEERFVSLEGRLVDVMPRLPAEEAGYNPTVAVEMKGEMAADVMYFPLKNVNNITLH